MTDIGSRPTTLPVSARAGRWEMVIITTDGPFGHLGSATVPWEALLALARHGIPVVFVSEDGADELVALQDELGTRAPYVSRGGEVHRPHGYFLTEGLPRALGWDSIQAAGGARALPTAYVTRRTGPAGWSEAVLGWEA